jgi:predicted HTH transcriptional regulator
MILKHRDKELLRFEWIEPQGVRIVSVNEKNRRFLPLDFKGEVSGENLWKWLSSRVVPRNRRNIDALMAATGLDALFKSGTVNPVHSESLALQIIANLKSDPFVSYDELSELMGVPRRTIARRIKELSDAGKIHRVGAAKNGHWEVLIR